MKFLGYFFAGLLGLAVLGVSILWGGAQMSLDRSYAHTKAAAQLRDFADNDADGVVRIATSRGDFRARIAGFQDSGERPLVVLLHGFPVTSAMWIDLIASLSEAGYRVVAFDQRGYSPAVRPQVVSEYAVPQLVADVFAVADAAGGGPFHLVGHDWGAAVGWGVGGVTSGVPLFSSASLKLGFPISLCTLCSCGVGAGVCVWCK